MIRASSVAAYNVLCDEGVAGEQRLAVYRSIVSSGRDGVTRQGVAEDTGLAINAVCGRVNELLRDSRVFEAGDTRTGVSGKQNLIVRAMKYNEAWVAALKRSMGWS